ncbi:hypothetical protein BDW59DRAFT_176390 [Aspergillus cavernicola]|uniref:G-protein coupled receptors family 2 profile 2 domain-containing protein n=1 Tax=Aspergillus cavernicola TaxID=176166 RepID=A0ABR4HGU0_9EURO
MASNDSLTQCPDPFVAELSIGDNGGYLAGRWCQPHTIGNETVSCCFPCPITDWRYSDDFTPDMVPWIGLAVLILMLISGLTYLVLPASETQRHYLTSAPLMGFIFMTIAFIIPLGPSVQYCHDAITPNYWLSDTTCAFSGSLILYGVWVLVIGCFCRSLYLYLQICWDIEPGPRFCTISLICIFAGSLALLAIALGVSGVSYQVGGMCYTSYPHSIPSFWAPLIALAFLSFVIQIYITAYCIRRVLTRGGTARISISISISIFNRPHSSSDALPPRQTSTRVSRILQLQWRAIAIACLILLYVVYVAQAVLRFRDPAQYSSNELQPWITCLTNTKGNKQACLNYANQLDPNQATVVSALALLASGGFWGFICTVRWSMVVAWRDWTLERKDALMDLLLPHRRHWRNRPRDLERVSSDTNSHSNTVVTSPTMLEEDIDRLYETREYHVRQCSFSVPGRARTDGASRAAGSGSTVTTLITRENAFEMKGVR